MKIVKSTKEILIESKGLEAKILQFKSTIIQEDNFLIFEKFLLPFTFFKSMLKLKQITL